MLFLFLSYMMLYVSTLLHPCRINAAVWLPHLSTMLEVCKFVSRYSSCVPVEVHTHSLRMLPPSYLATPQKNIFFLNRHVMPKTETGNTGEHWVVWGRLCGTKG